MIGTSARFIVLMIFKLRKFKIDAECNQYHMSDLKGIGFILLDLENGFR